MPTPSPCGEGVHNGETGHAFVPSGQDWCVPSGWRVAVAQDPPPRRWVCTLAKQTQLSLPLRCPAPCTLTAESTEGWPPSLPPAGHSESESEFDDEDEDEDEDDEDDDTEDFEDGEALELASEDGDAEGDSDAETAVSEVASQHSL